MTVEGGPSRGGSPHVLLLYRDESHRQARVVSWVRQGLVRGEKILYSSQAEDPLVPALAGVGEDEAPTPRPGQLTVLPAEEVFPGGTQAEHVRRALDEGYPAVRFSARADAGLLDTTAETYRAVDRLTDELCASLPVTALCQLDAGSAGDATLATVIQCHSGVEDAQMRLWRTADEVLALSGEVDFSSADVLSRALRCLCRPGPGSRSVVDLSELSFLDVAGCRALVVGTEALREAGGTVTLRGGRTHVLKVLTLTGADRVDGIELS